MYKLSSRLLFISVAVSFGGCAQPPAESLFCNGKALSYGDVPVFGSQVAGGSYLDSRHSKIIPKSSLSTPGALEGHWLTRDRVTTLLVDTCDSTEMQKCPSDSSFSDNFRIQIVDGKHAMFQQFFNAAYGSFYVFGADLDGDGIDEVVLEYGQGRGTFVYVRKLQIAKTGPNHLLDIFETDLNNYIGGEPQDGRSIIDPDSWIRLYAFTGPDRQGRFDIELCLLPPAETPHYLARTEWTAPLQFPKLVYSYNPTIRSYELSRFVFRRLQLKGGDKEYL
jgi:hypothetical protein